MYRSVLGGSTALALCASGLLLTTGAATSPAVGAPAAATTTPTPFVLSANGYSTRIKGGELPAGSDKSAYRSIGCNNRAGLNRTNYEAQVDLSPLGIASAAKTRVWTTKRDGVTSSWSRNYIANVTLGSAEQGQLILEGVTSLSRAYHNRTGFHAFTRQSVADIKVVPPGGGEPRDAQLPAPGQELTIPGLLTLELGPSIKRSGSQGAVAAADTIRITVLATGTTLTLAHSSAKIQSGILSGLFRGSSYASYVKAADGRVISRMTPYHLAPCRGSNGVITGKDIARINPNGIVVKGLTTRHRSDQTLHRAYAWQEGAVARAVLGNGRLVVTAVVGRANLDWARGEGVDTRLRGTQIGTILVDGQARSLPRFQTLTIPGLAKLERDIVSRTERSLKVIALRITLLDGSGAVINLGKAHISFTRSGL